MQPWKDDSLKALIAKGNQCIVLMEYEPAFVRDSIMSVCKSNKIVVS